MVHGALRSGRAYHGVSDPYPRHRAGEERSGDASWIPGDAEGRLPRRRAGKILHELRIGELAFFGEVPHSAYYGSVDTTPLFLLHEVWRWICDAEFVRTREGTRIFSSLLVWTLPRKFANQQRSSVIRRSGGER